MKVLLHHFDLTPTHPFTIARGTRKSIPSIIVELQYNGMSGFGEATANPYYNVTTDAIAKEIEQVISDIESIRLSMTPSEVSNKLFKILTSNFAICAVDEAYHDLYTKINHKKLYEYWKLSIDQVPLTSYTIGLDQKSKMIAKIKEMPWPIYKIKLGTSNDVEIIQSLRQHTKAVFIVDANASWTVQEALVNAVQLKDLGVLFIEQPLAADDWEGTKVLFENAVLPIIADESCQVEEDIEKCFGHFHGVNVKLMKCGGLAPAKRMIEKAQQLGLKTMAGCMTESSIGISAVAQLLPLLDYADMDGALLLSNNPASGVKFIEGKVVFSESNGIGGSLVIASKS